MRNSTAICHAPLPLPFMNDQAALRGDSFRIIIQEWKFIAPKDIFQSPLPTLPHWQPWPSVLERNHCTLSLTPPPLYSRCSLWRCPSLFTDGTSLSTIRILCSVYPINNASRELGTRSSYFSRLTSFLDIWIFSREMDCVVSAVELQPPKCMERRLERMGDERGLNLIVSTK